MTWLRRITYIANKEIVMRNRTKVIALSLIILFMSGCVSNDSNSNDIRPPLIDNTEFTNFVPTIVTNQTNN